MTIAVILAAALTAAPEGGPAPAAPPSASEQAVTAYPAAFFAAGQPSTALDMVTRLPGFAFDLGDSTVRGFAGAGGNVLIDGARPASKEMGLDEILKRIAASQVLRIEVIRGGAPGIDMQGKTVIANVILRKDGKASAMVALSGKLNYDGRVMPGLRIEASRRTGEVSLEGSFLAGQGNDDSIGSGPRVQRDGSGAIVGLANEVGKAAATEVNAAGAIQAPLWGGQARLSAFVDDKPYNLRQVDSLLPAGSGQELERDYDGKRQAEVGLRYTRPFGAKTSIEVYLLQQLADETYTAHYQDPSETSDFKLFSGTGESILRGSVKYQATPGLALESGAEGAFNWLNSRTTYIDDGAPVEVPAANVQVAEERGEAFFTATWQARPKLTLEGGVRVEGSRLTSAGDVVLSETLAYVKPRFVATFAPDAKDQFRLRVEHEVGQLNFTDFVATSALTSGEVRAGNPNLRPQQDWVLEGAWDRTFKGGAALSLTARQYWLTDVEDRAPIYADGTPFDGPANIGGGSKQELAVVLTLPTDRLGLAGGQVQAQSTWRNSRVTDPTTGLPRAISGLHDIDWEAHYTQGLPRLKADWGLDVYGAWTETYYRFDEIDTQRVHTWVAIFAEYKPRADVTLRAEVDNLTSRPDDLSRMVFDGPRNSAALTLYETRHLDVGPLLYMRVRKTFG